MSKKKTKQNSWHSIKQDKQKRSLTSDAKVRRLRLFAKTSVISLLSIVCIGFVFYGGLVMYETTDQLNIFSQSGALKKVKLDTDGVLNYKWFAKNIQLPKGENLMQVNIFDLKKELEAQPQIKNAIIEREFPDGLKILLKEYKPVARVVTKEAGRKRLLLVANDGHVYAGSCYSRELLQELPYLSGVRLAKNGKKYQSLEGMLIVAELLEVAQNGYPELYRSFKEISCRKFSGKPDEVGGVVKIKTADSHEIVFLAKNFPLQLSRLDYIMQHSKENGLRDIGTIDLTLGDHAVIKRVSTTQRRRVH